VVDFRLPPFFEARRDMLLGSDDFRKVIEVQLWPRSPKLTANAYRREDVQQVKADSLG
jgi:hypothetical protein